MKRVMKSLEHNEAIAVINPQSCNRKTIFVEVVQQSEGPIPHLHVYHDKTRDPEKCSYVRLDRAEYFTAHKGGKKLSDNLKKEFIEIMNEPWKKHIIETSSGYRPATGYEAAVEIWVDTYEHDSLDKFNTDEYGNIIQVDYTSL